MSVNRRWTLARQPDGAVAASDFALVEAAVDDTPPAPGEIVVRNLAFSVAPTIRNRLKPGGQRGAIPVGGTIGGMAVCQVIASAHPRYPVGARLTAMTGWEDVSRIAPDRSPVPPFGLPDDASLDDALGLFSPNSLTAYFGMTAIAKPQPGETVLVSGAAGSVGAIACQIARQRGARVIGLAGSAAKCRWLRDTCRIHAAIDYRHEDVAARLAELAPDGVHAFFDNVGGDLLQIAIDQIARHGRIAVCGQIAAYDRAGPAPGPRDMMRIVYGALRIEGFVVGDFVDRTDEAYACLRNWAAAGEVVVKIDRREGLAALPVGFVDLFSGGNDGTLIVVNDEAAANMEKAS